MRHHRNASVGNTNRPIYRHLKEHNINFQSLKLTIIKEVKDRTERKQQELALIKEFNHLDLMLSTKQSQDTPEVVPLVLIM